MPSAMVGWPTAAELADKFWTLADLDELESNFFELHKIEIVDGRLLVTNRPRQRHAEIIRRLIVRLTAVLPPHLVAISDVYIDLPTSARAPDVVVIARSLTDTTAVVDLMPSDVLLAIEVESRSSVTEDRKHKPAEYAAAGIPAYWHVTQDEPPLITAFSVNDSGGYDEVSGLAAVVHWPYPVDLTAA